MSIGQAFKQQVMAHLEALSDDLKPILKELIEYEYPCEVDTVAFEIFSDGFSSGFPVRAFFLDEDNDEYFIRIDGNAEYPSPVDPGLLEITGVYPRELEETYTAMDETLDPWDIAIEALVEWFSLCWQESGGCRFKRKANIAPHDSYHEFNLLSGKWQDR